MLLLWVLNRNSGLSNILDRPAQSALTFKINFEESENFAMENHGAQATILSFASNKSTCKLRERSTHSFFSLSSKYLLNTLYIPGSVLDIEDILEYQTKKITTKPRYKTLQLWGLYSMTGENKFVNKTFI